MEVNGLVYFRLHYLKLHHTEQRMIDYYFTGPGPGTPYDPMSCACGKKEGRGIFPTLTTNRKQQCDEKE